MTHTTTCPHNWVKLLAEPEAIPKPEYYAYREYTKNHWKRSALFCTCCGKTGYPVGGKIRTNLPHQHTVLMAFASDMARVFRFELPRVKKVAA